MVRSIPSKIQTHRAFFTFLTLILLIATLYWGRSFLIPLALASLLTFMLSPLVQPLCRAGLPRSLAVILVTLFTFMVLGFLGWLLGQQASSMADELPNYRHNITKRIDWFKKFGEEGLIAKMRQFGESLSIDVFGTPPPPESSTEAQEQASAPPSQEAGLATRALNRLLSTLAGGLGIASVVIVILIFMLLRLDDIGQRIVRLAGFNRLTTTTRALDEVSERVSHYLLMQATINGLYGLMLAIAMALVGLPYVILWGVLAALFRYIPYLGPIIVAVLPISFSLAYFDGWFQPLLVIGVILGLELLTNMILEPILYGKSIGVSDLAIIIAITFWTWLWGGIGLVLATPMTVCLVVFAKYIPSLQWVDILMGDKPQPQQYLNYYQQLISDDPELAHATIEESIEEKDLITTLETTLIPALALTRREATLSRLSREELAEVYQAIEQSLDHLDGDRFKIPEDKAEETVKDNDNVQEPITIFARALHGDADALALRSLNLLLPPHAQLEISREPHLIGELIQRVETHKPDLICISAMPPDASAAAVILCRRFRNRLPNIKILVCRWSLPEDELNDRHLLEAGATWVANSVSKAADIITRLAEK